MENLLPLELLWINNQKQSGTHISRWEKIDYQDIFPNVQKSIIWIIISIISNRCPASQIAGSPSGRARLTLGCFGAGWSRWSTWEIGRHLPIFCSRLTCLVHISLLLPEISPSINNNYQKNPETNDVLLLYPPMELTYPTWKKGTSSTQKCLRGYVGSLEDSLYNASSSSDHLDRYFVDHDWKTLNGTRSLVVGTSRNLTWNLEMNKFPRGASFSTNFFSGSMLNFGGVPIPLRNKQQRRYELLNTECRTISPVIVGIL